MASSDRSETSRTGSHTQPQHKPFANTTFRTNIVYSNTPTMSTTIKTTTEMYHVTFTYNGQRLFYNMTQQNIFQSLKTNKIFK